MGFAFVIGPSRPAAAPADAAPPLLTIPARDHAQAAPAGPEPPAPSVTPR